MMHYNAIWSWTATQTITIISEHPVYYSAKKAPCRHLHTPRTHTEIRGSKRTSALKEDNTQNYAMTYMPRQITRSFKHPLSITERINNKT